jgi:hypothetical protein
MRPQVYVLRDSEGFIYKLPFLDFYDDNGQKGAPTFALQRPWQWPLQP